MRPLFALALLVAAVHPAQAQVTSEYTGFDIDEDCAMIGRSPDQEGDWADFVCPGFANYPMMIRYTDGRESITYGFATQSGMGTFGPFNFAHDTVEWRVERDRDTVRPFATIHRWYLSDAEGNSRANQVLVVSRVGQPTGGGACAFAFVAASEGPAANERARELADTRAHDFQCGADRPIVEDGLEGLVGMPSS